MWFCYLLVVFGLVVSVVSGHFTYCLTLVTGLGAGSGLLVGYMLCLRVNSVGIWFSYTCIVLRGGCEFRC